MALTPIAGNRDIYTLYIYVIYIDMNLSIWGVGVPLRGLQCLLCVLCGLS